MRIVGLTGGIACGKSFVTSVLQEMKIPVLDCDLIARIVVEPGTTCRQQIIDAFSNDVQLLGEDILLPDGSLNRKALGRVVFPNEEKRALLTSFTGKAIFRYIVKEMIRHFVIGTPLLVIDAPTLYESKFLIKLCHEIVVIAITPETQLKRLLLRDKDLTEKDALSRINAQLPLEEKVKLANEVIWNEGSMDNTKASVLQVFSTQIEKSNSVMNRLLSGPGLVVIAGVAVACLVTLRNKL